MKRKALKLQKEILETIKKNPDISLSSLERKVRTNPRSLKEHCEQLARLGLIKIKKTKETTRVVVS
jgi:predicted transcriptional regulator